MYWLAPEPAAAGLSSAPARAGGGSGEPGGGASGAPGSAAVAGVGDWPFVCGMAAGRGVVPSHHQHVERPPGSRGVRALPDLVHALGSDRIDLFLLRLSIRGAT